jgi:hypothetical protein
MLVRRQDDVVLVVLEWAAVDVGGRFGELPVRMRSTTSWDGDGARVDRQAATRRLQSRE